MTRLNVVNPNEATGKAQELLAGVQSKLGMTPNMMRVMANSPAVLDAYLKFSGAVAGGSLAAKTREKIALAVGQNNSCDYCVSAHSAIGKMVGLTADEVESARRGQSSDAKEAAVLKLAGQLVDKRGFATDDDLAAARDAGIDDAEIAEIVANVALNLFTNYFNHVAQTEIDFPVAEPLACDSEGKSCNNHEEACSVS
ncbi:carboxymuconolactone decarboxylase family protein [Rhodopirellula sp. JC740]|uniref:Carboxymuconolactone decarboxylase family protein n=1 Tax=Rhodopirellula halodulae TaxID=2894198 RepID=A0ABS8NM99_9BACT|nr:carboxymuconolactone decarboxylase family protein [Rhodopirellula sp. JC740]MCC9643601.1 carboxymuconolactone decarboxylase family protein [Rhodopirellula sp. JC740]